MRSALAEVEMLAPDLQRRLATVEIHGAAADFDAWSWAWMLLLGVVLPAVLLAIGWWLCRSNPRALPMRAPGR